MRGLGWDGEVRVGGSLILPGIATERSEEEFVYTVTKFQDDGREDEGMSTGLGGSGR